MCVKKVTIVVYKSETLTRAMEAPKSAPRERSISQRFVASFCNYLLKTIAKVCFFFDTTK